MIFHVKRSRAGKASGAKQGQFPERLKECREVDFGEGCVMNLAKFPRRVYVREPTLIGYPPNFSKRWGGRGNVYIKRDDLPPGCAGNKICSFDFRTADAFACGAVQSGHFRRALFSATADRTLQIFHREKIVSGFCRWIRSFPFLSYPCSP